MELFKKKTRNERMCFMCEANDIGDEYHYLMLCPAFKDLRTLYLPKYYRERPSVFKFIQLMQVESGPLLVKVARFFQRYFEYYTIKTKFSVIPPTSSFYFAFLKQSKCSEALNKYTN